MTEKHGSGTYPHVPSLSIIHWGVLAFCSHKFMLCKVILIASFSKEDFLPPGVATQYHCHTRTSGYLCSGTSGQKPGGGNGLRPPQKEAGLLLHSGGREDMCSCAPDDPLWCLLVHFFPIVIIHKHLYQLQLSKDVVIRVSEYLGMGVQVTALEKPLMLVKVKAECIEKVLHPMNYSSEMTSS